MAKMTPEDLRNFQRALDEQRANDRREGRVPTESLKGSTSSTPSTYAPGVVVKPGIGNGRPR